MHTKLQPTQEQLVDCSSFCPIFLISVQILQLKYQLLQQLFIVTEGLKHVISFLKNCDWKLNIQQKNREILEQEFQSSFALVKSFF